MRSCTTGRVANVRNHLAFAVPLDDQILLLGPPYKVPKDATIQSVEILNSLRRGDEEDDPTAASGELPGDAEIHSRSQRRSILSTTESSGARRLFLFSKQALSENAPDPPACRLEPMELQLPSDAPGSSPLNMTQSTIASQPLHQALSAYERQFMLYLCQGRVLADGADMRLRACVQCVQEQAVLARALRAAVSNLSDHFNGAARTRTEFSSTFQSKAAAHSSLLHRFESILNSLGNIPLHQSLVAIARGSGRMMETLLDTVPVERERAWALQCQTSHDRLLLLFSELDTSFGKLGSPSSREVETKQDLVAEQEIQELSDEVQVLARAIRDRQARRLEKLTADHGAVLKIIMDAINAETEEGKEDEVQKAFTPLRQISNDSKDVVPEMEVDDNILKELMQKVATAKTEAMKRMKNRLREVSVAQSSIQRVLSSVSVLKAALSQQCDNMVHLEHVAELSTSYRDFLSELRRRRAYAHAVSSNCTSMMERLAIMRNDEVRARERFLRGSGRHLMPPFFEIFVPTLATPPPLFTPQLPALVELDSIPDVGEADIPDASMQGTTDPGGVSTTSSLTADSHKSQVDRTAAAPEETMATQQDQLIVSADEHSGNDVIMSSGADEAERKTLAYENAMLRQTLERLGEKPTKTYIEETLAKDARSNDIAELRKEIERAKVEAKTAQDALILLKKGNLKESDKISHSSFEVGDVGLFMPTGRGSGGKRTYLAFHTNCPHRYLSTDNINGNPDYVLGRIVYQEELVAGEAGTAANPYNLHVGTKFWVLTVEILTPRSS